MAALAFHAAVARVASLTGPRRRDAARSSSSAAAATTTTCRAGRDDDYYRDGYRDEPIPAAERRRSDERRYYDGGRRSSRVNDYYDRRARPTGDSRPAMEPPRRRVGPEDDAAGRTPRRRRERDDGFRAREAAMRAEADARAAREESMWRDAYAKRVREKRRRWDEWDDMAAEEDSARKDRVARARSAKPAFKTPEQRRDRLARYRDISRRADETWASAIERRWTADEEYARATGQRPRGDGLDRTMDWLFTPLAGAARRIDKWLEEDPYNPLTNPEYYGGYDAPPLPPPGVVYDQYDYPGGSAMNAMGWGGRRPPPPTQPAPRSQRDGLDEDAYYSSRAAAPFPPSPPPPPRRRGDGPNPIRDAFRGGGASGRQGRDDDPITPEEFERLRGGGGGGGGSEPDFDRYRGTVSGRRGRRGRY